MLVATHATQIKLSDDRLHILPDGRFRSTDSRPVSPKAGWLLNAQIAEKLKAKRQTRKNQMLIDFEHQSLLSSANGKPAPAAGWSNALKYIEGEGLFLTEINWTPRAQKMLENDEYKYASAVFSYDAKTGEIQEVINAALTNTPGLDGLTEAKLSAALNLSPINLSNQGVKPMNEHVLSLLKTLKVDPENADAAICKAIVEDHNQLTDFKSQNQKLSDERDAALKQIATLNSEIVKLKTAQTEAESRAAAKEKADLIAEAMSSDQPKLLPAMKEWAESLELSALKTYLEHAQIISGITNQQGVRGNVNSTANLSAEEIEVAERMQINPEDFAAAKVGKPAPDSKDTNVNKE